MKQAILIVFSIILLSSIYAEARSGCCSHHKGVCGCKCCDGTSLSAKCAPYYPECSGSGKDSPESVDIAAEFSGKVVGLSDGDTLTVLAGKTQVKVRLAGIDCPEKSQAFGTKARQFASSLVFEKTVAVKPSGKDRYGRTIGEIVLDDGRVLNHELVRAGMAWWYREYAPNDTALKALEDEARAAKAGLWADPSPVAPWDFRRKK